MRILHVITRFLRGGAEEKTLKELEGLRGEHEYVVATGPEVRPEAVSRLNDLGVAHQIVPALRHYRPWQAPSALRQLRRTIRQGRFDLVHTHSTEAGILGRMAATKVGAPRIVHTIHGHEFSTAHPFLIRKSVIALHRRLAPATDRFFSNADILSQTFLAAGIGRPEQYVTIRSGIDLAAARKVPRVALEGSPALLAAGRLERGKGFEELLDAVRRLGARLPDLRLSIAGDGPLRRRLENQARDLDISARVLFLGFRSDLPGLMRGADAFVLASHREGTPRVITEALAVGCPVVATRVDGVPEQVIDGQSGLLVGPRDPRGLAEALQRVFADPEAAAGRARLGQATIQSFDAARMIQGLRAQYRDLETTPGPKRS